MEIMPVAEILQGAGLNSPTFSALIPDVANYNAILFQPKGQIEASVAGVRNRDRELAARQFAKFLEEAASRNTDLAVTPEYSMPWDVLTAAIKNGIAPGDGRLWVLGCESIKRQELEALPTDLAEHAIVLHEPLEEEADKFLDPLSYVFLAPGPNGQKRLVVLVQFKTRPMGGPDHFEVSNLQRGTRVYQLGGDGGTLRLVSLQCSDVFGFEDAHANAIYDRSLVIHIQLNPKPRQHQYRQYREKLLGFSGDATELVCLNWAADVVEWCNGQEKPWNNICGTAWYLRPDRFDLRDDTLRENHRKGMYYTWLEHLRYHALFFNYAPAVFMIEASKVAHIGVQGALSQRRGPQLRNTLVWDAAADHWIIQEASDDGFAGIVDEYGEAREELQQLADSNPIFAERVLALSSGKVGRNEDWHAVKQLDSCKIEASEVIRRMTFCQDTAESAREFRTARLSLFRRLMTILSTPANLPPALADLKDGFQLEWSYAAPHCNVRAAKGPATVLYMGEQAGKSAIEEARSRLAEFLRRSAGADENPTARQRLAVWYQDDGELQLLDPDRYVQFDRSETDSEIDIARPG